MQVYSVPWIAKMLSVNQETVRRWIHDNKLRAKCGLGRGGHAIRLQDIVDFANQPPRTYLLALEVWLEREGIPYVRIKDGTAVAIAKKVYNPITAATVVNYGIVGAGILPMARALAKATKRKSYLDYSIRLVADDEEVVGAGSAEELRDRFAIASGGDVADIDPKKEGEIRSLAEQFFSEKEKSRNIQMDHIAPRQLLTKETRTKENDAETNKLTGEVSAELEKFPSLMNEIAQSVQRVDAGETAAEESAVELKRSRNVLDEIAQAKQLLDIGVLTPEEFAEIKARLIARI